LRVPFTWFAISYWSAIGIYAVAIALFGINASAVSSTASTSHAFEPGFGFFGKDGNSWAIVLGVASLVSAGLSVVGWVFSCILLARMWSVLQGEPARTTPGQAVGLLHIPFFAFYWVFVAFHGLAQDLNAAIERRQLSSARQVSEGLVLTTMIFWVCWWVPLLNYVIFPAFLILFFISMLGLKNAASLVASMPETPDQSSAGLPQSA
jgi:hypothetical protein